VLETLLNTKEAAALLGVQPRTLEAWRCKGGGPVFVKVGASCVRYRPADLDGFISGSTKTNTSGSAA
jgi:phage terminase Nu1 subunit (DNA packaging protein)